MADPLIRKLGTRLKYGQNQQQLLVKNMANQNVPGYRAEILAPQDQKKTFKTQLQVTNAKHIRPSKDNLGAQGFKKTKLDSLSEKPSGNNVDIDQHIGLLGELDLELSTLTSAFGQYAKLYKQMLTGK